MTRTIGAPRRINGDRESVVVPSNSRVFVVTGIARPDRFASDILSVGWDICGAIEFRDHHRFTARDVRRIAAEAKATGSMIVLTTEKDAVRLAACDLGVLPIASVPLLVGVEPAEAFGQWLLDRDSHAAVRFRRAGMRHRLEYLIVRVLIAIVRVTPRGNRARRRNVSRPGLLHAGRSSPPDRLSQPGDRVSDASEAERRAIARAAFAHFGRLLFELLQFSTLSREQMLARVEFDGEERSRLAYAQHKGVLFITGHFGFWELQAMVHAVRAEPVSIVARALDNPHLNRLLEDIRQGTGNSVIYRRGTIRRVMRALQAGRGVAVLIDQHIMSRDAIYVDFFERPAATTSAVAALALRTGAPVVPVFALHWAAAGIG